MGVEGFRGLAVLGLKGLGLWVKGLRALGALVLRVSGFEREVLNGFRGFRLNPKP